MIMGPLLCRYGCNVFILLAFWIGVLDNVKICAYLEVVVPGLLVISSLVYM